MPISKLRPTFTLTEDRLKELQAVVPEAFADGRINWDTLREALGETLEDEAQENFGLFWPGKREARRLAAMPSKGTLIPQPGAGVDEDNTHNLFIEGDNLEVLKLLQKSYAGRVKMIYIDPPYNTGNDFVYSDDFSEPLETYLKRTGQVDETGQLLTTNNRASGRFHSNWLNMMFPRLYLARKLMRDDGVMFISIDDNEVNNLRLLCDEIFGPQNTETMIWHKVGDDSGRLKITYRFRREHEYILAVYKNKDSVFFNKFLSDRNYKNEYTNPDNDPRGAYKQGIISQTEENSKPSGKNYFTVTTPSGRKISRQFRVTEIEFMELLKDNRIYFGKSGDSIPSLKVFVNEQKETTPISLLQNLGTAKSAGLALKDLFDGVEVFDYPKPVELIRHLIKISTSSDDLIFDFFSGSSTTAEALIEENETDAGNRKFILIQLPEPCSPESEAFKAGFKSIADVGKERIRRVLKLITSGNKKQMQLSDKRDLGFKSFSLDHSNFAEWEPITEKDTSQLELRFNQAETPLVEGWSPKNLLAEILLLQGFPLESSVTSLPEFKANEVKEVTSEFVGHHLYVCLDKKVKAETVVKLSLRVEDILVCLDSALSDEAKVKLADQFNLKVI